MAQRLDYARFVRSKCTEATPVGFDVPAEHLASSQLFPFQRDIVQWALRRGRAAVFADTGMGKTLIQLTWAAHVAAHTGKPVLILAPLAVSYQTAREGAKFGLAVTICVQATDVRPGINVTNYEKLHHFVSGAFGGLVLDESGILKSFDGVTRTALNRFTTTIYYRLACTATPAPNDLIELRNHAEFLSVMTGKEILALFFTQDGDAHTWRLKHHAHQDFWRWLASWAVAVRRPSDLGYDDTAFVLPPLHTQQHIVASRGVDGYLFPVPAKGLLEVRAAQRASLKERVAACAALVAAEPAEPWLIWCHLNAESTALAKAIPGAVEVSGADTTEHKEAAARWFAGLQCLCNTVPCICGQTNGHRRLICKPSMFGHGLNFQHCARMAFVGLSYSWEQWYQAIRRCWRYGQHRPVQVHVVIAQSEGAVVKALERKERQADQMFADLITHVRTLQLDRSARHEMEYAEDVATGKGWTLWLGDAAEQLARLAPQSVGLCLFSPPFPGMYAYTNSMRDLGNTRGMDEMLAHFAYVLPALYRVMMPGRLVCIHLIQIPAMKHRDGYIGIKDYRGRIITAMEAAGLLYAGEVTIDKNPQVQAIRVKERGLLFKSLATDASVMRMALADYVLYFRMPGSNPRPIRAGMSARYNPTAGWITDTEWIEWAAPVWYRRMDRDTGQAQPGYPSLHGQTVGISETDVLNVSCARDAKDERHLCPLQLGVIERCVKLWSAPGDVVLDPFAGIGSTGYVALRLRRDFVGIELKASYWRQAQKYLAEAATHEQAALPLFSADAIG